jgi:hypothetical protein
MNRNVLGLIPIVGLVMVVLMFFAVIFWASANDFGVYNIVMASEGLYNQSIIDAGTFAEIESVASEYYEIIEFFDYFFLAGILIFIGGTISLSYFSRSAEDGEFFSLLFIGSMFMLFMLSMVAVFTDWFQTNLLYLIIPNLEGTFLFFDFYYTNIGVISFIQFLVCLFVNKVDFKDFNKGNTEVVVDNNEVV